MRLSNGRSVETTECCVYYTAVILAVNKLILFLFLTISFGFCLPHGSNRRRRMKIRPSPLEIEHTRGHASLLLSMAAQVFLVS